jgi:phosphoribosylglycinamide formyltransferase-1
MTQPHAATRRFVVLISGRGSNMQCIVEQAQAQRWPAEFVRVIANEEHAGGIAWAQSQAIPTSVVPHRAFDSRRAFDEQLALTIEAERPDYVLLAGFMRILTPEFVRRFKNRLINIHPSLLPAFPGLKTHAQAIAAGVGWHGCTVHFVTDQLDHGPIIAQGAVAVSDTDDASTLEQKVLGIEHVLYPRVVQWLAEGRVKINDAGQVCLNGVIKRHLWMQE